MRDLPFRAGPIQETCAQVDHAGDMAATRKRKLNHTYQGICFFFSCFFNHRFYFPVKLVEVLPSAIFWTSRGHVPSPRCVCYFFVAHRVQHPHRSSIFIEMSLSHALALSANQLFYARKSLHEYALGETRTHEIDLDRHADLLPSHRRRM